MVPRTADGVLQNTAPFIAAISIGYFWMVLGYHSADVSFHPENLMAKRGTMGRRGENKKQIHTHFSGAFILIYSLPQSSAILL